MKLETDKLINILNSHDIICRKENFYFSSNAGVSNYCTCKLHNHTLYFYDYFPTKNFEPMFEVVIINNNSKKTIMNKCVHVKYKNYTEEYFYKFINSFLGEVHGL